MDKTIYCSECKKRGIAPKKLCVVEDVEFAEGKVRLWCKQCRAEILVSIHNGNVSTEYARRKIDNT